MKILALVILAFCSQGIPLCVECPHPDDPRIKARICPGLVEDGRVVVTLDSIFGSRTKRMLPASSDPVTVGLLILAPQDGATWGDVADAGDPCSMIQWR